MMLFNVILAVCALQILNVNCKLGKSTQNEDCKDRFSSLRCHSLVKTGACTSKTKAMRHICPQSCGFCGSNCRDVFAAKCPLWVEHGACQSHPEKLNEWCRKSCGYCKTDAQPLVGCKGSWYGCCWDGTTTAKGPGMKGCGVCKDWMALCKVFKIDCHSVRNGPFMRFNCPQTCGLCN